MKTLTQIAAATILTALLASIQSEAWAKKSSRRPACEDCAPAKLLNESVQAWNYFEKAGSADVQTSIGRTLHYFESFPKLPAQIQVNLFKPVESLVRELSPYDAEGRLVTAIIDLTRANDDLRKELEIFLAGLNSPDTVVTVEKCKTDNLINSVQEKLCFVNAGVTGNGDLISGTDQHLTPEQINICLHPFNFENCVKTANAQ